MCSSVVSLKVKPTCSTCQGYQLPKRVTLRMQLTPWAAARGAETLGIPRPWLVLQCPPETPHWLRYLLEVCEHLSEYLALGSGGLTLVLTPALGLCVGFFHYGATELWGCQGWSPQEGTCPWRDLPRREPTWSKGLRCPSSAHLPSLPAPKDGARCSPKVTSGPPDPALGRTLCQAALT